MHRRHSKILAILLLLVFSQQAGLRLWMHHWFHEGAAPSKIAAASEKFKILCDCFDEAMLPLQETPIFALSIPLRPSTALATDRSFSIPARDRIYCSLKGPPALQVSRQ